MSRAEARRRVTSASCSAMAGIWYDYRLAEQRRDEAPSVYKDSARSRARSANSSRSPGAAPVLNYKGP